MYWKLKCVCPRVSVSQLKILGFWINLFSGNREHTVPPKTQQDIGGSKGGARDARPPGGPDSFIFMQFSAKNWKIIALLGVGVPPGENPGSATTGYDKNEYYKVKKHRCIPQTKKMTTWCKNDYLSLNFQDIWSQISCNSNSMVKPTLRSQQCVLKLAQSTFFR